VNAADMMAKATRVAEPAALLLGVGEVESLKHPECTLMSGPDQIERDIINASDSLVATQREISWGKQMMIDEPAIVNAEGAR